MAFKVRLLNEVSEGIERGAALTALAKLFKVDESALNNKLQSNSIVVKNDVSAVQAELYQQKIEQTGFKAKIETAAEDWDVSGITESSTTAQNQSDSSQNSKPIILGQDFSLPSIIFYVVMTFALLGLFIVMGG